MKSQILSLNQKKILGVYKLSVKQINEELKKEREVLHKYTMDYASCSDVEESEMLLGCISVLKEDIRNLNIIVKHI